ncbi:MAG: helix-turn-helix transcriptional regulator [Nanobdellota archaeon]
MERQDLRNMLLAIALIMGFIFIVSFSIYVIKENYGYHGASCGCSLSIPIFIALLASLGVFVGILTYYFLSKSFSQEKEKLFGDVEKTLDFLDKEEKDIVQVLVKNKGDMTQNILNKKLDMDPVKIHRRLQNLESKGVIHKEKKGMTNKITLKDEFRELFTR